MTTEAVSGDLVEQTDSVESVDLANAIAQMIAAGIDPYTGLPAELDDNGHLRR